MSANICAYLTFKKYVSTITLCFVELDYTAYGYFASN